MKQTRTVESKDDKIRNRDQQRLRAMIALQGDSIASRHVRIILQFLQAEDTCRLLGAAVTMNASHASAVLLRFGIDTLATGFWFAFVAPATFFSGQGNVHIPSDVSRIVPTLPKPAQDLLRSVLDRPINNDPTRTLLKDVLNPATHGDALVNVQRIGSAPTFGFDWGAHLRDIMVSLTNNFTVILREEGNFDLKDEIEKYIQAPKAGRRKVS